MEKYSELWLKMRSNHITQKQLAEHMGLSKQWICEVFNGKKDSANMFDRIESAINEIIEERT